MNGESHDDDEVELIRISFDVPVDVDIAIRRLAVVLAVPYAHAAALTMMTGVSHQNEMQSEADDFGSDLESDD